MLNSSAYIKPEAGHRITDGNPHLYRYWTAPAPEPSIFYSDPVTAQLVHYEQVAGQLGGNVRLGPLGNIVERGLDVLTTAGVVTERERLFRFDDEGSGATTTSAKFALFVRALREINTSLVLLARKAEEQ